jgi:hypothetical protein
MSSIRIALLVCAMALVATSCRTEVAPPKATSQNAKSALDLPIETIAASGKGRAVLDKDFPGLCNHAMYGFFKSMSLHQIAAMSKGRMTPAMMAKAEIDLAPLTFASAAPQPDIDAMDPAPRQAARNAPE